MILGGMGPYSEPKTEGGKLFEGFYALYSGLLLIGVTGLILAPIIHHIMHLYHLPDDENRPNPLSRRRGDQGLRPALMPSVVRTRTSPMRKSDPLTRGKK